MQPLYKNRVSTIALATLLAIVVSVLILIILLFGPSACGLNAEEYVLEEVYAFEKIAFRHSCADISFGSGHLVPVYREGDVCGVILLGEGRYRIIPPSDEGRILKEAIGANRLEDQISAVYLGGDYQKIEDLKDLAWAERVDDWAVAQQATQILNSRKRHATIQFLGVARLFVDSRESIVNEFFGERYGLVQLMETDQAYLTLVATGKTFALSTPNGQPEPPTSAIWVVVSTAVFALIVLVLLALVHLLTVDLDPAPPPQGTLPREESFFLLASLMVYLGGQTLFTFFWPAYQLQGLLLLVLTLCVGWWFQRQDHDIESYLGITDDHWLRAALMAILVAFLATTTGSLALPVGLQDLTLGGFILTLVSSLLLLGLAQALFCHGYLQTTLEYALGPKWGLAATAALVGAFHLIPKLSLLGTPGQLSLLQALTILPATALIAGYLFQRTHNIIAPAVFLGLVELMPKILLF